MARPQAQELEGASTIAEAARRVDDDGFIAEEMTAKFTKSSEDDPSTVPCLLKQIDSPIRRFITDGAYDTRSVLRAAR